MATILFVSAIALATDVYGPADRVVTSNLSPIVVRHPDGDRVVVDLGYRRFGVLIEDAPDELFWADGGVRRSLDVDGDGIRRAWPETIVGAILQRWVTVFWVQVGAVGAQRCRSPPAWRISCAGWDSNPHVLTDPGV